MPIEAKAPTIPYIHSEPVGMHAPLPDFAQYLVRPQPQRNDQQFEYYNLERLPGGRVSRMGAQKVEHAPVQTPVPISGADQIAWLYAIPPVVGAIRDRKNRFRGFMSGVAIDGTLLSGGCVPTQTPLTENPPAIESPLPTNSPTNESLPIVGTDTAVPGTPEVRLISPDYTSYVPRGEVFGLNSDTLKAIKEGKTEAPSGFPISFIDTYIANNKSVANSLAGLEDTKNFDYQYLTFAQNKSGLNNVTVGVRIAKSNGAVSVAMVCGTTCLEVPVYTNIPQGYKVEWVALPTGVKASNLVGGIYDNAIKLAVYVPGEEKLSAIMSPSEKRFVPSPTEAPTVSVDVLTLQSPELWTAAFKEQYKLLFSDPFGVTVFDGTMSAANRTEWKKQLETLDVQLDNAWHEKLTSDTTQWQAKLNEWGMPAPDITKWDSLSIADKRSAVKAYWKAHDIVEGNLPSSYIIDARNDLNNYVLLHKENNISIGFKDLDPSRGFDRSFTQMELNNTLPNGTRGKFSMFGEGVRIPWISTWHSFTTRGDGIIGTAHIIGVDSSVAQYLWLDANDDRSAFSNMRRDVFSIVSLKALSLRGGLCVDSGNNTFTETQCSPDKTTQGFVTIDSANLDAVAGIKQVTDTDKFLALLAACQSNNCIIQASTSAEFPLFINGIRVVDSLGLYGTP